MAQPSDRNAFMFKPASTSLITLGIRAALAGIIAARRRRLRRPGHPTGSEGIG
jgi:hypothetical protein